MTSPAPAPQTTIAGGVDRSTAVLGLGLLLIVTNFLFTPQGSTAFGALLGSPTQTGAPQVVWYDILLQFFFLFLLVLLSRVDSEAGTFALLFVVALWLGWIVKNVNLWAPKLTRAPDLQRQR